MSAVLLAGCGQKDQLRTGRRQAFHAAESVRIHHLLGTSLFKVMCQDAAGRPMQARKDIEWIDADSAPPYDVTVRFTGPKDRDCDPRHH
jgi:hypothetical protein